MTDMRRVIDLILQELAAAGKPPVNKDAPAFGRKAVIYATCFANYNSPGIGMSTLSILAKNGVETEVVYPECCGMPQLEQGDIGRVADAARKVAAALHGSKKATTSSPLCRRAA